MASYDVQSQLAKFLGIFDTTDIIMYLESFNSKQDLEEYIYGLLDESNDEHKQFAEFYLDQWAPGGKSAKKPTVVPLVTKSKNFDHDSIKKSEPTKDLMQNQESTPPRQQKQPKQKYSPLIYTKHGIATPQVQLPGRFTCHCEATKHNLVNNCLSCGKIVCEQEGSGPCTFCGNLVCTKAEQDILDKDSKSSEKLLRKLMGSGFARKIHGKDGDDPGFKKAEDHKNKLLEFDQTMEKRTKIIDDQSDYYTLDNLWLTKEERVLLRSRDLAVNDEANSKKAPRVTFDFAGRQVVEESSTAQEELEKSYEMQLEQLSSQEKSLKVELNNYEFQRPIYDDNQLLKCDSKAKISNKENYKGMRLQGNELQEMNDQGWCLSMHQPYASLLVAGLKMHEGRTWYTAIRGRLWIASTSQTPSETSIKTLEESIRILKPNNESFPKNYPVGALLGYVNVVDCLSQEEYQEKFPSGESSSPFVFICENPQELIVKFPNRGKHKIYKLDTRIHDAAKKTLRAVD